MRFRTCLNTVEWTGPTHQNRENKGDGQDHFQEWFFHYREKPGVFSTIKAPSLPLGNLIIIPHIEFTCLNSEKHGVFYVRRPWLGAVVGSRSPRDGHDAPDPPTTPSTRRTPLKSSGSAHSL